jgi:hypothetical protein
VPHTPRFLALALFGRRLSERSDGLGIPASENLHITGSQLISRSLVGAPFLAKASFISKTPARFTDRDLIAFLASVLG